MSDTEAKDGGEAELVEETLTDGSAGVALICGTLPVEPRAVRSVFRLGLALGALLFSVIALIALPFLGFAGQLTAVLSLLLPFGALMTPAMTMLERALDYRTLARAEVLQAMIHSRFSVTEAGRRAGIRASARAVLHRDPAVLALLFVVGPRLAFRRPLRFGRGAGAPGLQEA